MSNAHANNAEESQAEVEALRRRVVQLESANAELQQQLAAARQSESQYRLLVEQLPVGTYIATLDEIGSTLYTSPQFELLLGFPPDEQATRPRLWFEQLHPDDRDQVLAALKRSRLLAEPFVADYRLLTAEGRVVWLHDEARVVYTSPGQAVLKGIWQDITERKRAEEALGESEERFRRLAENAADIIYRFHFGPRPGFDYISPAVTTVTGYTPEEYYANPNLVFRRLYPDDRLIIASLRQSFLSSSTLVTLRWLRRDGAVIWTEHRIMPIYDAAGRLVAIEGIARDVTEQKQAEAELHQRIEQLHVLYRLTDSLARAWELEDVYQEALNAIQRVFKADRAAIVLYGADGLISFKDWRGLSPTYRQAMEDYTPWPPGTTDPQPILLSDIAGAAGLSSVQDILKDEDLHAIGFIPLVDSHHLFGRFMFGFDAPRQFSDDDLQMAKAVASHIAFALKHKQAQVELARSGALIATLNKVGARLQTSLEFNRMMETMGAGLKQLGITCCVSLLNPETGVLEWLYDSIDPTSLVFTEQLIGLKVRHLRLTPESFPHYAEVVERRQPVFTTETVSILPPVFPGLPCARFERPRQVKSSTIKGTLLYLPLVADNQVLGMLNLWGQSLRREDIPMLSVFAAQAASAIQNAWLFEAVHNHHKQLEALSHRLVEVQETERRIIARELHDEIGQVLTGVRLLLEMAMQPPGRAVLAPPLVRASGRSPLLRPGTGGRAGAEEVPPRDPVLANLAEAQTLVSDLITQVQNLSLGLRPTMLDDLGLLATLLWHFERYTAQTGIRVHFEHSQLNRRFEPAVETAAYRIVQEALTNVARYAGVTDVLVQAWVKTDRLGVQIIDQGAGFDSEAVLTAGHSTGLSGMRERATLLGGRWTLKSVPGAGTQVTAEIPVGEEADPGAEG